MPNKTNPAQWIENRIKTFVTQSPLNRLGPDMVEPAFDAPMVGFSSGGDPLYDEYVAHIGDFYLTPAEIYRRAFPGSEPASGETLTVISWILPSTRSTRDEQARQKKKPSERWARVRFHGEDFNVALRKHVVASLEEVGVQAVAPMLADFGAARIRAPMPPAPTGRSGMPPMPAAWAHSDCATASSPRWARPCAPAQWWRARRSQRPPGLMPIIGPTVCIIPTAPAASASPSAR
jgi:hypothetical protein